MNDTDVRDLLARVADEVPATPADPEPLVRRGYRRMARTAVAGALGVACAIALVVGSVGLIRSNTPTTMPADEGQPTEPSPVTQPPSPLTERFDSPLHGLSIGYPSGWQTRAATEPWGHGDVAFDAPDVDVIFDPTLRDDVYIAMVSEPLGLKSARDWVTAQLLQLSSVGICPDRPGLGGGGGGDTFHGEYAWFWGCDEPHGASGSVVIVATAARGYIIYFHVANDRLEATYGHMFKSALKTVDLRPEDALAS